VREILEPTFHENQSPFPEHGFFEFLAKNERCAEIFKSILIDHGQLIVESPYWMEIFCTLPAFFHLAVEVYVSNWDFVVRIVNDFNYQTLSASDLHALLQVMCGQEKWLCKLNLVVQFRLFEAIMNALTMDTSVQFQRFCLDFLVRLKGNRLYEKMDDQMKDLLFERLLNPLSHLPVAPVGDIKGIIAAITRPPQFEDEPEPTEEARPPGVDPRTIRAWLLTIADSLDLTVAAPELLVAINQLLQAAVMHPEIGFDFGLVQTCLAMWAQIHARMDVPIDPGFLPLLYRRIQTLDQDPMDPRFEGNREMSDVFVGFVRVLQEKPRYFANLIASIVNHD
jgi:hypothetical protein